jgi:predicted nucleic acid-binding protein
VRLFLDSSVVVSASLSATGASREVFRHAVSQGWQLLVSPWVLREVRDNLAGKPPEATRAWIALRADTTVEGDELVFDWPIVFEASKDKPVLFTALACADILLTLDRRDFLGLLGETIYGLKIETPGHFLRTERESGRLR